MNLQETNILLQKRFIHHLSPLPATSLSSLVNFPGVDFACPRLANFSAFPRLAWNAVLPPLLATLVLESLLIFVRTVENISLTSLDL
jgi:hypothetical protein